MGSSCCRMAPDAPCRRLGQPAAIAIGYSNIDPIKPAAANSRVKDLVDLALLIGSGGLDKQRILDALRLTFERRGTHDLPASLVPPPADWQIPFHALAEECGLPTDVAAVFAGVQEFLEEVLAQRTER